LSNGAHELRSRSYCNITHIFGLNISVQWSDIRFSRALSRAFSCGCFHFMTLSLLACFRCIWQRPGYQCTLLFLLITHFAEHSVISRAFSISSC
jgi:hypothetical protein